MENRGPVALDESPGYLNNAFRLAMSAALRIIEMAPKNDPKEADPIGSGGSHATSNGHANSLPEITLDQVSWHDQVDDCWIILYDRVYDVTEFLQDHPGGADILMEYAGRDATLAFRGFGHSAQAWQILQRYLVGTLPEKERTHIFTQCELGIDYRLKVAS